MKSPARILLALACTLSTLSVLVLFPGDTVAAAAYDSPVSLHLPHGGPAILSPSFQVLHGFSGADGGSPNALVQGADGFIYGSAANGGDTAMCPSDGCGTLFKMDSSGNFVVLHVFHATDGYLPTGLIQTPDGSFYGTAASGGQPSGGGAGTLFRMDTAGNMTVLYRFVGGFACCDGAGPSGPPVLASDGNLYGVTGAGGAFRDIDHQGGFGTFYRFNPVTSSLTILHSFNLADGNGIFPNGPLVQGTDGSFYGTTREGGGGVFKVDAGGNLTLLHKITDSGEPLAGLIQAADGFLYGTTDGPSGTVFRVDAAGNYAVVNRFDGGDGFGLNHAVMQASDGLFYGTAPEGGLLDFQGGDLFRLDASGHLAVPHSFSTTNPDGGYIPNSKLIQGADGLIYGTTGLGGPHLRGTVFRLDPGAPGPVASLAVKPAMVAAGQSATGTVTLSSPAPAGGRVVSLRAASFQVTVPASVTVPAGATSASFKIQTSAVGNNGDVRIYAFVAGAGIRTIMTITAPLPHLASLTLKPESVQGGAPSTGTVMLTGAAPAGGAVVMLASSSPFAVVPASVTVPAGATAATFVVTTRAVNASKRVTISARYNGGILKANLTILRFVSFTRPAQLPAFEP